MKFKKNIRLILILQKANYQSVYKIIIKKYSTKKSYFLSIHRVFYIKTIFSKVKKNILRFPKIHYVFNLLPFDRLKCIWYLNTIIINAYLFIMAFLSVISKKNLVIFSDFWLYSYIKKLKPKLYLICPDLYKLKKNKQVNLIETVRLLAIKSEVIFTTTLKDMEEVSRFNKNVIQTVNQ